MWWLHLNLVERERARGGVVVVEEECVALSTIQSKPSHTCLSPPPFLAHSSALRPSIPPSLFGYLSLSHLQPDFIPPSRLVHVTGGVEIRLSRKRRGGERYLRHEAERERGREAEEGGVEGGRGGREGWEGRGGRDGGRERMVWRERRIGRDGGKRACVTIRNRPT